MSLRCRTNVCFESIGEAPALPAASAAISDERRNVRRSTIVSFGFATEQRLLIVPISAASRLLSGHLLAIFTGGEMPKVVENFD
jgi:hypothetical protein